MADEGTECLDGHKCYNGALCIEDPDHEGKFACDCDVDMGKNAVYAGLACEHEATVYCNFEDQVSYTSFCTNHGTCVEKVAWNGEHLGCNCKDGYNGDFCEFVKRSSDLASVSEPMPPRGVSHSDRSGAVVALSVVAAIVGAVGLTAAFLIFRRRKVSSTSSTPPANGLDLSEKMADPSELNLDADGEVLKSSMAQMNSIKEKAADTTVDTVPAQDVI